MWSRLQIPRLSHETLGVVALIRSYCHLVIALNPLDHHQGGLALGRAIACNTPTSATIPLRFSISTGPL